MVMTRFCARVRKHPDLPTISIKEVYEHPTPRTLAATFPAVDGADTAEQRLANVLAEVMGLETVPVDSHFFDDLGADSMVMTRFCARVRKHPDLPTISIKEVYEHPTPRTLAANGNGASAPAPSAEPSPGPTAELDPTHSLPPVGTLSYVLCGSLQLLTMFGYLYLVLLALVGGYGWISAAEGILAIFVRAAVVGNGVLLATSIFPILAKWILVGRWKPQEFRVWGVRYFRFWVVKTLVGTSPLALFAGSPIYVLFLRALGAKIGRGALVLSRHVPVCTDLLTIGDNTVVRKDSFFNCYRAHAGLIQIGPVTLGRDVHVGEMTVLDINTSMGDGAQLGHSSSLSAGQSIPAGEHRYGSPAQESTVFDYRNVPPAPYGRLRRFTFSVAQLLNWIVFSSLLFGAIIAVVSFIEGRLYFDVSDISIFSEPMFYWDALLISGVLLFGSILVGLVVVATVPRLLNLALKPDRTYPLYGPRYWIHRVIGRMTNVPLFTRLFGDSSYIVRYLRWVGYDLSNDVVQTGSNFGLMVKHDNPYLVSIGRGSMIADGLSAINADYSDTAFRLSRVTIGENNFLGNYVAYPSQGKTGANCLLGTKVLVPVDGEVHRGTGLLGAPSFHIPRSVQRDLGLNHPQSPEDFHRRLAAKNRHNLVTMGMFLLGQWVFSFTFILITIGLADLTQVTGVNVFALAMPFTLLLRALYQVLIERSTILFRRQKARQCSIYDPYFWSHERFWKLTATAMYLPMFSGTPLRTFFWRILGVRVGKRLFDDGCHIPERTMVTVGDHCTFNVGSYLWCHSQEDGAFKSDYIEVGAGCTLGVGAFVHYGVTIGDGAQLASGSLLVKGEEVPPYTRWEGNTAMEVEDFSAVAAGQLPAEQRSLVAIAG
jgi:non-ribosomal peptide synthetase-like protein